MAKFALYASSPDGLAQQQMAEERYYTGVAESNRAANVDAQKFNIQAWVDSQRADEAARVRDEGMRVQKFQDSLNRSQAQEQNNYARGIDLRNFADKNADEAARIEREKPMLAAQTSLLNAQAAHASENNPTVIMGHNLALQASQQGLITDPTQASKQFGIPIEAAQQYHMQSQNAQRAIDAQDAEIENAAHVMTQYEQAQRKLKELSTENVASDFWHPGHPNKDAHDAEVAKWNSVITQLSPRVTFLQSPKKQDILNQLQINPETGTYQPILPVRPWRSGGTPSTDQTPEASPDSKPWAWSNNLPTATGTLPMGSSFAAPVVTPPFTVNTNPLAAYEGKIINQGGRIFRVVNGVPIPQ